MKHLFLIILLACSIRLQAQNHNLVIIDESGKKFTLYLNEDKVNPQAETNVKAFSLGEGVQKIKIEYEDGKEFTDSIKIKPLEKNHSKEFTYAIRIQKHDPQKRMLVFVSAEDLSGPEVPVVPARPVYVEVKDNNLYGNLYKAKDDKPEFFQNYNEDTKVCAIKLNDSEIEYGINLINKTTDLEYKAKYAEAILAKNCYTTTQLLKVLGLLDSEMDKLKLSKLAYGHLSDQQNAHKVNDIFKYKAFKDDYEAYLRDMIIAGNKMSMNCTEPVNEKEFTVILKEIQSAQYQYDKIKVAKKSTAEKCLSTAQVKRVLMIFTHDREKLEFAKAAYPGVVDRSNYLTLEEELQFTESRTDLKKFLSK